MKVHSLLGWARVLYQARAPKQGRLRETFARAGWFAGVFSIAGAAALAEPVLGYESQPPAPARSTQPTDRATPPAVDLEVPSICPWALLSASELPSLAVPLPEAQPLLLEVHAQARREEVTPERQTSRRYAPGIILIKFQQAKHVAVLRVEAGREAEARQLLAARPDVAFAELDHLQERQFLPNDPDVGSQWHHAVIDTFSAWDISLGNSTLRIGIVDYPFQMDHPDLAANTVPGWSVVTNAPITESAGIDHSTISAGMAAAAVNNGLGVAGAANCAILPLHITGFTTELYNAVVWAATNDVRIVSASWTGADEQTLNEAGAYLRQTAGGLLFMAGVNGTGLLDYPAFPDIWCISMTDAADNLGSQYGEHIDFAAPGFEIFSTATLSGYQTASGTSYSTPLVAGVAALLLAINPTLDPDQVTQILKDTADDLGPPGWDRFFGWGRIHAGRAAAAARATLPQIHWANRSDAGFTVAFDSNANLEFSLWATLGVARENWVLIPNAISGTAGTFQTLTDPAPPPSGQLYRVQATRRPAGSGAP